MSQVAKEFNFSGPQRDEMLGGADRWFLNRQNGRELEAMHGDGDDVPRIKSCSIGFDVTSHWQAKR